MAFQGINVPFKLTPEDMGITDFGRALAQGMERYGKGVEALNKPHQLAQNLLASKLQNQINSSKAQYAPQMALAELQGKQGEVGMQPLSKKILEAQYNKAMSDYQEQQDFKNLISNKGGQGAGNQAVASYSPGMGQAPFGAQDMSQPKQEGQSTESNVNEQVLTPGNPQLQHINDLYNNYPQYRSKLDKMGYKQTQSVHYDPKTNTSYVTTQHPNGMVTVRSMGSHNSSSGQKLTNAIHTKNQNAILGVPKVKEKIQALIDAPSPSHFEHWPLSMYRANSRAEHDALVNEATEGYIASQGWKLTDKSMASASKILDRHEYETDGAYRDRLRKELKTLDTDLSKAQKSEGINPTGVTKAPEIPSHIKTKKQFQQWKKTLNPGQLQALKQKHLG